MNRYVHALKEGVSNTYTIVMVFLILLAAVVYIFYAQVVATDDAMSVNQIFNDHVSYIDLESGYEQGRTAYYVLDGQVYYESKSIPGVDLASFRILDFDWATDDQRVYNGADIQSHLSPQQFRIHSYPYISDAHSVWLRPNVYVDESNERRVPADVETFSGINYWYGKDKNHVYHMSEIIYGADPGTFELFADDPRDSNYYYAKDRHTIYYRATALGGVQAESFELLGGGYAKDASTLYYQGETLSEADVTQYDVLGDGYSKDAIFVFYRGQQLELDIDPKTTRLLENGILADANSVYAIRYDTALDEVVHGVVAGADPKTTEVVGSCATGKYFSHFYLQDKNNVYINTGVLNHIDATTFVYYEDYDYGPGGYGSVSARDDYAFYMGCGHVVTEVEPATFTYVGHGYHVHDTVLWYMDRPVPDANVNSLKLQGYGYIVDDSSAYYLGEIVNGADPSTFEAIQEGLARDKDHMYRYEQRCRQKTVFSCY